MEVSCGIPQGSALGPLLFAIYVNDLHTAVRQSRVQLYADDTCLYYSAKNATSVETALNEDLKHISEWLACNKLKLNVQKCEFIIFGSKHRLKRLPPNITINLNREIVPRVSSCKYLGMTLDENLDWSLHIKAVCRKVVLNIYLLKRIRNFISKQQATIFYKLMIQCHFDYCDTVYSNAGVTLLRKLQILQNRALRTVLKVEPRSSSTQLYISLKLDNIQTRFRKREAVTMHKIFNSNAPKYLLDRFHTVNVTYNIRGSGRDFSLPKARTNFIHMSFLQGGQSLEQVTSECERNRESRTF